MAAYEMMVTLESTNQTPQRQPTEFFLDKNAAGFYEWQDWFAEKGLERMVYRLSKNPEYLAGHLERIYYCFQHGLSEQLFGALVDLLHVLGGKGRALCRRMVLGAKSKLSETQFNDLLAYLESLNVKTMLPPDSRYSVFTDGAQSRRKFIDIIGAK